MRYRLHCFCQSGNSYKVRSRFPHISAWLERLLKIPGWGLPYDILPGERIAPKWPA